MPRIMDLSRVILQWTWGNNPTHDEYTSCRGYVFGGYNGSMANYLAMARLASVAFPDLKQADIEFDRVLHSSHQKNFCYVHFALPAGTTHPDYHRYTGDFWGSGVNYHPYDKAVGTFRKPDTLRGVLATCRTDGGQVRAAVETLFDSIDTPTLAQTELMTAIVASFRRLGLAEEFLDKLLGKIETASTYPDLTADGLAEWDRANPQ